jgi:hypothetical protein
LYRKQALLSRKHASASRTNKPEQQPEEQESSGGLDEIVGVMEALGQTTVASAESLEPGEPIHASVSPERPGRRRGSSAGRGAGAPAAAEGGGHKGREEDEDAFYKSWRVRKYRPSSPDYVFSQPASKGGMVSALGLTAVSTSTTLHMPA